MCHQGRGEGAGDKGEDNPAGDTQCHDVLSRQSDRQQGRIAAHERDEAAMQFQKTQDVDKPSQGAEPDGQDDDMVIETGHAGACHFRRRALRTTIRDDDDMAMAAISGVTSPRTASGMATRL